MKHLATAALGLALLSGQAFAQFGGLGKGTPPAPAPAASPATPAPTPKAVEPKPNPKPAPAAKAEKVDKRASAAARVSRSVTVAPASLAYLKQAAEHFNAAASISAPK